MREEKKIRSGMDDENILFFRLGEQQQPSEVDSARGCQGWRIEAERPPRTQSGGAVSAQPHGAGRRPSHRQALCPCEGRRSHSIPCERHLQPPPLGPDGSPALTSSAGRVRGLFFLFGPLVRRARDAQNGGRLLRQKRFLGARPPSPTPTSRRRRCPWPCLGQEGDFGANLASTIVVAPGCCCPATPMANRVAGAALTSTHTHLHMVSDGLGLGLCIGACGCMRLSVLGAARVCILSLHSTLAALSPLMSSSIISAAFSATAYTVHCGFAPSCSGITLASTTLSRPTP